MVIRITLVRRFALEIDLVGTLVPTSVTTVKMDANPANQRFSTSSKHAVMWER